MDSGQENKKQNGDSYNFNDQELIRQLIKSRMSQGQICLDMNCRQDLSFRCSVNLQ